MIETPAWFHNAILDGLQRLKLLSLDGEPAASTLQAVHRVWVEALWPGRDWQKERDSGRLREAFRRLSTSADRWPQPRHVVQALPPRPRPPAVEHKLSEKQRRRNRRRLRTLIERHLK